ncbi:MAG: hypothetical protein J1E58_08040 [Prevotella sp.]|nr:hypothetical protein [Prevotella sp.]
MNKVLTTIFLSFLCQILSAQERNLVEEMTGNYIQIRQRAGTESLLSEWLKPISIEEDTVYAILYIPMECPRCEAAIPNFVEKLKDVDTRQKILLITANPDSLLAKDYNQRNEYAADGYLYDTAEHYRQIFDTNMEGDLMGVHILKIDRKNGNLLTGGQYTVLNNLFVQQLIAYQGILEKSSFATTANAGGSGGTAFPDGMRPLTIYQDYPIDPSVRISTIYDVPRFVGDKLFFTDLLQNGVMLFKQKESRMEYQGLLQVSDTEKNRFVNVPEDVYQHFVNHKMLFYIALGTNLLDDAHIGISYSIPRIVSDGGKDKYGFYNAPVILSREMETMLPDSMIALSMAFESDTTFFNTHFSFARHQGKIIIGCQKLTWPLEYEREEYEDIPELNPFGQGFYENSTPFVAAFSEKDGKLFKRYGQLDVSQALSRTGYYFFNPLAASSGPELLYTNGYTGKVSIVAEDGETEEDYQVFSIDTSSFPPLDSTLFYTYDHVKPYKRFFNRCITDVKFDKEYIYCIVKYAMSDDSKEARYAYMTVNRQSREVQEYAIPQTHEMILGAGLQGTKQKISPFIILKDFIKATVRVYSIN